MKQNACEMSPSLQHRTQTIQDTSEMQSYFWMLLWRLVKFWPHRSSVLRLMVRLMESMQTLSVATHEQIVIMLK